MLLRIIICALLLSIYGCQFTNKQEATKTIEESSQEPSSKTPFWRSLNNGVDILPDMSITDSVISKKPWKNIKLSIFKMEREEANCIICNDNFEFYKTLSDNLNAVCIVNDQYAIVCTDGEFSTVISVFPAFDSTLEEVTIDFNNALYTLTDSNFDDMAFFQGLYDNYLFVDTGTSSGSRGVFVVNLDVGKIIFGSYTSKTPSFDGKKLKYWVDTEKETKYFCPNIEHIEHYSVVEKIEYDLTNLKGKKTGEFECVFEE